MTLTLQPEDKEERDRVREEMDPSKLARTLERSIAKVSVSCRVYERPMEWRSAVGLPTILMFRDVHV